MSYQVVVIGGDPGGYVAAIRAAQMGAKVALVEKDEVGGTCLNWGCIPTKALVAGAETLHKVRRAEEFGIRVGEVSINYARKNPDQAPPESGKDNRTTPADDTAKPKSDSPSVNNPAGGTQGDNSGSKDSRSQGSGSSDGSGSSSSSGGSGGRR